MKTYPRHIRVNEHGRIVYDSEGRLPLMKPTVLMCHCGDCKHWEILSDGIKCMSCQETYALVAVLKSAQDQVFKSLNAGVSASFQMEP